MMIPVCDVLPAPLCDALNEINRFPVVIRLNWAADTARTHHCKRMLLLLLPANHDFPVIVTAQHQRHSSMNRRRKLCSHLRIINPDCPTTIYVLGLLV